MTTEHIDCTTGPEMEATARRLAAERGLKMVSRRGWGEGLAPKGPSIGLWDAAGNEVVRVWATNAHVKTKHPLSR